MKSRLELVIKAVLQKALQVVADNLLVQHLLACRLHTSSLALFPSPKLAVTLDLRRDFLETFYFLAVAPMLMSGSLIGINKCNE